MIFNIGDIGMRSANKKIQVLCIGNIDMRPVNKKMQAAVDYVQVDEASTRPHGKFILWCNKVANELIQNGFVTESIYADPKNMYMVICYSAHHTWKEVADEMKKVGWKKLKAQFKLWM